MASITMTLDEWNQHLAAKARVEEELAKMRNELNAERSKDPTGRLDALAAIGRSAVEIARFAVANLPPETVKGWPYSHLNRIAQAMKELPDFGIDDGDLRNELLAFAREAQRHEARRAAVAE